jgi:IrrE N-terminal-like domain
MGQNKKNQAAKELWGQVFSRLSAQHNASMWNENYDGNADELRMRQGFREAGWSDTVVDSMLHFQEQTISRTTRTSPGVNPYAEFFFDTLSTEVESAIERLNIDSHNLVARGIEPRLGPFASNINVIMTDESIVTVGVHLFRYCNLISKAFTRTLFLAPFFWESNQYEKERGLTLVTNDQNLLRYWLGIYSSYALTGTNILTPFKPTNQREITLTAQVTRAMELFSIAHEYGHHYLGHGRDILADQRTEEFEADRFALRICNEIEKESGQLYNPYLPSGAGAHYIVSLAGNAKSITASLQ